MQSKLSAGDVNAVGPGTTDRNLTQVRLVLQGAIDPVRFRSTWQKLVDQHEEYRICRSRPEGRGPSTHGAVVARLPWQDHDLRNIPTDTARQWLESFLETDRNQDIPVDHAPLMRCALIRLDDRIFDFIWSYHPGLFDRAGACRVLEEIAALYKGAPAGAGNKLDGSTTSWTTTAMFADGRALEPLGPPTDSANHQQPIACADFEPLNESADDIENRLIEIWQVVLSKNRIGIRDNFFELGGHSLLAAKLLIRIEECFDKAIPFASLLETPTIEQQARLIRGDTSSAALNELPKRDRGPSDSPFFLFGDSPTFRGLSQNLSAAGTVYSLGLHPSLISELRDPYSLECMAEQFVHEIRKRQPEGPYFLGGWCAHGLLAFEAAQQLRAQGQRIGLLFLIETVHPVRRMEYPRWKRFIATNQLKWHLAQFELQYLRQLDRSQKRKYVIGRVAQKISRIKRSVTKHLNFNQDLDRGAHNDPLSLLYAAAAKYCPAPYEGPAVLFRSLQRTFGFGQELQLGWGDMLGDQLEICETPGTHYTIYAKPNVDILTGKMIPLLQQAKKQFQEKQPVRNANES